MTLFRFHDVPAPAELALASLPPVLGRWFRARFGDPTPVQRLAWPALASGGHLLVSARFMRQQASLLPAE
jgi:hypothetical protein